MVIIWPVFLGASAEENLKDGFQHIFSVGGICSFLLAHSFWPPQRGPANRSFVHLDELENIDWANSGTETSFRQN